MLIAMTGGTGFVGRHLVEQLLHDGHRVRVLTRRSDEELKQLFPRTTPEISVVEGSFEQPDRLSTLVEGVDAVVHAGVAMRGDSFIGGEGDANDYLRANVMGSQHLFQAAIDHSVERLVFVSTGAVHGRTLEGVIDETHPLWPTSLYGIAKASIETMVHGYSAMGSICATTVRPVTIYGVKDPVSSSRYFKLVEAISKGEEIDVAGGGKVVHVEDVAGAIRLMLASPVEQVCGETFNLVDQYISKAEAASKIAEVLGLLLRAKGGPTNKSLNMSSEKVKRLGLVFGGEERFGSTIEQLCAGLITRR